MDLGVGLYGPPTVDGPDAGVPVYVTISLNHLFFCAIASITLRIFL